MPIYIREYCPHCKTLRNYRRCEEIAYTCVGKTEVPYDWLYARCATCNHIIPIPEYEEVSRRNLAKARLKAAHLIK